MDKYEQVTRSKKQIITNNFIGGISWGIGVTVGIAILFVLLTILASKVNFVPIIGDFISNVINYILNNNPPITHSMPFVWTHYAYA